MPVTACIVPAAGQGTRMQGAYGETKQLISLCGVPLIVHTLEALERAQSIGAVVLAVREQEMAQMLHLVQEFDLSKVVSDRGGRGHEDEVGGQGHGGPAAL